MVGATTPSAAIYADRWMATLNKQASSSRGSGSSGGIIASASDGGCDASGARATHHNSAAAHTSHATHAAAHAGSTTATRVRKRMACGGFTIAACFGVAAFAAPTTAVQAVVWIGLSSAASFVASGGGYEPAKLEVASPEVAGLLQGISQTVGNSAALVSVPIAAAIATAASWDAVFLFLAASYGLAAVVFWRWGTAKRLFHQPDCRA